MTVSVTHTTQTAQPNDPSKDVSATAWNEAHTVTGLGTAAVADATDFATAAHTHAGVYEPADATILKDADIGVTVQAYDSTYLVDADIGSSVAAQGHNHSGVYQPVDADLTAIAALTDTGGYAKRTAADTWSIATPTAADVGAAATSHAHGNITSGGLIGSTANIPIITGTAGILQAGSFGTGANTFCVGNDSRLSDDRTASGIRTATTTVSVSGATAPNNGQVLTATSSTNATWQTPSGAAPTGVLSDLQMSILQGDGSLSAASGVQTWAGTDKTGQDVFTVAANTTYRVRGQWIVNTGTTTHTTAMAFALATATVTDFQYQVLLWSAAANTLTTTQTTVHVSGVASKVLNATSTAVYTNIRFEGIMVVGTGGTVTPQINFSANPTGTNLMKRGSWTSFEKLGANTVTVVGGWA